VSIYLQESTEGFIRRTLSLQMTRVLINMSYNVIIIPVRRIAAKTICKVIINY